MPSAMQRLTPSKASETKLIRSESSSVEMPFSVTKTGIPPVISQALRIVASRPCGQRSYPMVVRGTPGSTSRAPSGPHAIRL